MATDGSSPATRLLAPGTDSVCSRRGRRTASGSRCWAARAARLPALYVVDVGSDGGLAGGLQARRIGPVAPTRFDPGPAPTSANAYDGPRWSPDGTELAVADPTGVVVVQADGSDPRLVATPGFNPAWSPDGGSIAFQRTVDPSEFYMDRPCTVRTWIVDADGTNERALDRWATAVAPRRCGPLTGRGSQGS